MEVLRLAVVDQRAAAPADASVQCLELPSRAIPPRMAQRTADRVSVEVLQLPVVDQGAVVGADVVGGLAVSTAKPVQRIHLPARPIPPRVAQQARARLG